MTTTERLAARKVEQLKDRRAYRQTLIHRQEDLERKLARVEEDIRNLETRKAA